MKYTHLYNRIANTYFTSKDETLLERRTTKKRQLLFISIGVAALVILSLILFIFTSIFNKPFSVAPRKKSLFVLGNILPLKLNYEFTQTPEKIKSITLDLPQINLADYDTLEFTMRGDKARGFSSLIKIELMSRRREKKSFYLRGIESRWKTFKIPLSQIFTSRKFSDLASITFIIEAWNIDNQEGRIFIDKIRFSKKEKG